MKFIAFWHNDRVIRDGVQPLGYYGVDDVFAHILLSV
jgi:hypothetical protein